MPVNTRLQVRRGSGELWTSVDPTLYAGEIGYETNTGKIKVGDGLTAWTTLDYVSVPLNSGNFIEGSGITIVYDTSNAANGFATWHIDEAWLDNFISTSSGSLNVEGVQDIIGNSGVVGGFGINKSYDDGTGFTTISATGMALRVDESTGIGVSTSSENNNNVYTVSVTGIEHTLINDWTEAVKDTVGTNAGSGFLVNSTGVAWNYNDGSDELSVAVTGIPHTLITDWDAAVSGSIPDNVDTLLVEGTGIGFVYNSGANSLTIGVTGVLADLSTNLTSTAAELNVLDGVSPGTVSAGDAVVVDSNKNIGDFNSITSVVFSGDLVGDVTGNADTATEATTVTTVSANNTNDNYYLTFVDGPSGALAIETDGDLRYNPSTNTLSVENIVGNISGGAAQVQTVTTDTGTHYLTFVDSDNGSATAETVRTDGDLSYNALTNTLSLGNISTTGTVSIGGDLTVAGTTTTVNSTVVEIGDNVIRVNTSGLPTGGFEVLESGTSNYKQFVWDSVDDRWELGTENLQANRFVSTQSSPTAPLVVASTGLVTNLNSDLLDGQHGSYYLDWGNFSNFPDPVITVSLSGDVVGSDNITWTNLNGNVSLSLNTTIQPNSVALSGDTTGDYVESVNVAGTGLTIDITSGEAQKPTITSNATPANTANTIVSRDASGNFSAGTITAALSGNASTATKLATARYIELTGDVTGSGLFDGSTNIQISTTVEGAGTVTLADESSDQDNYITFANDATGEEALKTNTSLRFNALNKILLGSAVGAPATPATRLEYFIVDGGTP